ncbi:copper resistance protein B [Geobacter sp. DSM 9736]|uniref:copper resistance protein B n=1 Tax=Geobacter sp. DSM 9736 TaxID=1277350 RepID=UPI000B4FFE87|nr:copper resistance protein B [Geobacter sp. DSM 9736]SNB45367.1 copper resistance protein B [Geobacter sp. DSM 9736]
MRRKSFRQLLRLVPLLVLATTWGEARAGEGWPSPVHDSPVIGYLLTDLLEYQRDSDGGDRVRWDIFGWVGGDYNRIWLKTEGTHDLSGRPAGETDAQVLYGRLISPFWDFQVGARQEWKYGPGPDRTRTFAVIGFQGVAPYWFEVEPSLFISEEGDISARITAEYDLLLTQRLILQPRVETELAVQKVEKFGVGSGMSNIEMGLRLRYEMEREFAPYIGITWRRDLGETANITRREGGEPEELSLAAGVRIWF